MDERSTVRLWLVRYDFTTTVGIGGRAEVQIKAAEPFDDNGSPVAQWTTIFVLNDEHPVFDIIGVDDQTRYRVVRSEAFPYLAVDRSSDSGLSSTVNPHIDNSQTDFNDADDKPARFKVESGASGTYSGFSYDYAAGNPGGFGVLIDVPELSRPDSSIKAYVDSATETFTFELHNEAQDTDWSSYEGGIVLLSTECYSDQQNVYSFAFNIPPGSSTATGITVSLSTATGQPGEGFEDVLVDGKTCFITLIRPAEVVEPIAFGPRTGRFSVDRNQVPARLTAAPLDADETLKLSFVEGTTVIPWLSGGSQVQLDADNTGIVIASPGEYEWERSCNSSPGVYLNTGWK